MRVSIPTLALLLAAPLAAGAQTSGPSANPDSTMAPAAGNTGGANKGVGTAGSLTEDSGSHSSAMQDAGAIGDKASHPAPSAATKPGDAKLETDPTQGAGGQSK